MKENNIKLKKTKQCNACTLKIQKIQNKSTNEGLHNYDLI